MKYIADSGECSDDCLKYGFLPVAVHFYQPIPDIAELEKRKVWDKISKLKGLKFEPEKYLSFLKEMALKYSDECDWPNEPDNNPNNFYLHNSTFSYGCAAPLHCIIRFHKPKKIIEIGSGFSSKIIKAAINLNKKENYLTEYIIIDPYTYLDEKYFSQNTTIIRKPVELMDPEYFKILQEGDILFIDSSHVSKIGSDVNFEILEVLPLLNKGVLIHFHDISLPYEYPKIYSITPAFRVFWTEAYLLQAFLAFNSDFEIILPMNYLENEYINDLKKMYPKSIKTNFGFVSGSFWIKRIKLTENPNPQN